MYVGYVRVSTNKQGIQGYGISDQEQIIQRYVGDQPLVKIFREQESGSSSSRPELLKAIDLCKKEGHTLVIARVDRLARNVAFTASLMDSGVKFVACDNPGMDKLTIHIFAAIAEKYLDDLRRNTKAALAQAKKRGVKLGNPNIKQVSRLGSKAQQTNAAAFADQIKPIIDEIKRVGKVKTLTGIANALNARGIKSRTNKIWYPSSVRNVLAA